LNVYAQNLNITFLDSIHGDFTKYSIDNFGNIYTSNKDVVVKYSSKIDTLFSTSIKSLMPSSLESSKSFRVLLFDKERGVISFLDNTLTEINGDIDLADLDVLQAVLVSESFNGDAFWVLDEGEMQLLKVNQYFEVISRIDNLNFLFENKKSPIQMFEQNDELAIHYPNNGIAIFDVFGTYIKYYSFKSQWINIKGKYLFSLENSKIKIYGLPLMDSYKEINLPNGNYCSFQIVNQKLYLKTDTSLLIFSIDKTNE
jgi:hypothetical protein